jgi:hypothetical protein
MDFFMTGGPLATRRRNMKNWMLSVRMQLNPASSG